MKTCTIWTLTLCLCLLAACGAPVQEEPPSGGTVPAVQTLDRAGDTPAGESVGPGQPEPSLAEDEVPSQFTCRIVDIAENGSLLLAELDGGPSGCLTRTPPRFPWTASPFMPPVCRTA